MPILDAVWLFSEAIMEYHHCAFLTETRCAMATALVDTVTNSIFLAVNGGCCEMKCLYSLAT